MTLDNNFFLPKTDIDHDENQIKERSTFEVHFRNPPTKARGFNSAFTGLEDSRIQDQSKTEWHVGVTSEYLGDPDFD